MHPRAYPAWMKRGAVIVGVTLLLGGTAVALLRQEDNGRPPTEEQLRTRGFAVWPEDTLAEAEEACREPEPWQLDPEETALRFAREVFDFSEAGLHAENMGEGDSSAHQRYHVNADGEDLGSIISVIKYGDCWVVDGAEPREGWWLPSIGFAHRQGKTELLVSTQGSGTDVGYGTLDQHISGEPEQVVIDISELPPDATGHVIAAGTADALGYVPPPATNSVTKMTLKEIIAQPDICNGEDSSKHPHFALSELIGFGLGRQTRGVSSREIELRGSDRVERIDGDTWGLIVQGTRLTAEVPKIRGGCWRALTMKSRSSRPPVKSLLLSDESATFELNRGRATSASVTLSGDRGGGSWTFEPFAGPITVASHGAWSFLDGSLQVTVVLRNGQRIVSAQRTWVTP